MWRLDANVAGSGITGDLLAHNIDTALWSHGNINEVSAMTEIFDKSRKTLSLGRKNGKHRRRRRVFSAFFNGSLATFEATRDARGYKALHTFEINGGRASVKWDLHDLHRLKYFDQGEQEQLRGWKNVHVTDSDH